MTKETTEPKALIDANQVLEQLKAVRYLNTDFMEGIKYAIEVIEKEPIIPATIHHMKAERLPVTPDPETAGWKKVSKELPEVGQFVLGAKNHKQSMQGSQSANTG